MCRPRLGRGLAVTELPAVSQAPASKFAGWTEKVNEVAACRPTVADAVTVVVAVGVGALGPSDFPAQATFDNSASDIKVSNDDGRFIGTQAASERPFAQNVPAYARLTFASESRWSRRRSRILPVELLFAHEIRIVCVRRPVKREAAASRIAPARTAQPGALFLTVLRPEQGTHRPRALSRCCLWVDGFPDATGTKVSAADGATALGVGPTGGS